MRNFNKFITEAAISKNNLDKVADIFRRIVEKSLSTKLYRFAGPKGFAEIKSGVGILYFYNQKKAMRLNYIKGAIESITMWSDYKSGKKGDFTIDLGGMGLLQAGKRLIDVLKMPKTGNIRTQPAYLEESLLTEASRLAPSAFFELVAKNKPSSVQMNGVSWAVLSDIAVSNGYQIPSVVRSLRVAGTKGPNTKYDLNRLLADVPDPDVPAKNNERDYYIKITAQDTQTKKFASVRGDKIAAEMLQKIAQGMENPDVKKEMKDPETLFGIMANLVQLVCRRNRNSLIVYGGPGIGKCAAPEELIDIRDKIVTYESLFKDITAHVENIETDHIYPCDGIEVETPSGWVGVLGVMKKTGKGVRIVTADGAIFHGEEKHTIFGSEGWEYLKDVEFVVTKENSLDKVISREYTGETTFYDISIPSPHSYYSPNGLIHHNTFVVTQTVNSEGLQKGKDWFIIKGKITTASLYQTLFMHREGGLLIFDDADSVWGDAEAANVLKAALDSYETRTISWISGRTVNVSRMSDEEKTDFNVNLDRKIQENPEDPKNKFPSEFEFEGRIIFISNLKYEKFDSAVLNRSAKIDMSLTQDQVFLRMKSILQHLGDKSVPIDIKVEILGFLQAQTNKGLMTDVSMRTFVAAEDTYRSGLPNWKDLIDYV